MDKEKIIFHLHDDTSNCNGYADSCTNFKDYIKLAKRDGDKAIAFSNHGGIYDWVKKKQECDKVQYKCNECGETMNKEVNSCSKCEGNNLTQTVKPIKYIHGIEAYMCDRLEDNDRGYHIGLYARNWDGVLELNTLISKSFSKGVKEDNSDRHVYYNPRLSMEEIMGTSDNIVITTACVQSILWRFTEMSKSLEGIKEEEIIKTNIKDRLNQFKIKAMDKETLEKYGKQKGKKRLEFLSQIDGDIEQLKNHYMDRRNVFLKWIVENKHRVFIEAQAHLFEDQMEYNKLLMKWHDAYGLKIIAGTDTHSSTDYKAECRKILQVSKDSFYGDEDKADLTWKNYDGIVDMFKKQNVLSDEKIHEAIGNTVVFGDMFEDYELDTSFKYPDFYKDAKQELRDMVELEYQKKKDSDEVDKSRDDEYRVKIEEELSAFDTQGMSGFILFVAEMLNWCHENDIPTGDRGSFTGSTVGFITNMTDVDPVVWKTVFSRFCNVHRISLGDIDIDFVPEHRARVYEYIVDRFSSKNTSYILTFSTLADRGTIDVLSKGLNHDSNDLEKVKKIKDEFDDLHTSYKKIIKDEIDLEELDSADSYAKSVDFQFHDVYMRYMTDQFKICEIDRLNDEWQILKNSEKELFYYFEGIKGTIVAKGQHPAGMIGSPITLNDNLCVHYKDGDESMPISSSTMKSVDSLNYVKFDILGLKTLGIIKDAEKYAGIKHRRSYEINWTDEKIWKNMIENPVGVFQFEGKFAFDLLKRFEPHTITHMSMINASLRPSGKSYRDRLVNKEFNNNPSKEIDDLLKENNGFLIFQEDTIKFLTDICGFDGGTADIIRRAIGKKDHDTLMEYMPKIMDGYVKHSGKDRKTAEIEAKEFLQIIEDSSEYQFGFNHSTGYSQNGYRCVDLRTYYPIEFTTAYLNRATSAKHKLMGTSLTKEYGFEIKPIQFRYSISDYNFDKATNSIYKGVKAVKGLGVSTGDELYALKNNEYETFVDVILDIITNTKVNKSKIEKLIKLDYFKEFGGYKRLLKIHAMFFDKNIYSKSTAKFDSLPFDESIIEVFSKKKTEKQYSGVDYVSVLREVSKTVSEEDDVLKEMVDSHIELLGDVELIYGKDWKRTVVTTVKRNEYNTRMSLYCLSRGVTKQFKLKKKDYREEFEVGDILYINNFEETYKLVPQKDEDGEIIRNKKGKPVGYDKLDETELVLLRYKIESEGA